MTFKELREGGEFILTNYNCRPSRQLLRDPGYYKIVWAREKDCSVSIDDYDINLSEHQLLFATPTSRIAIPLNSGITSIAFTKEFYCIRENDPDVSCNGLLFYGSSTPPVVNLNLTDVESFDMMFAIFREEFTDRGKIQGEMLRLMLKRLLIKSVRLLNDRKAVLDLPGTDVELIKNFHLLVEEHFRDRHQVSAYAEELYKSPKTLSNVFNRAGYPSPVRVINARILLEAKRLLLFSDHSAKEIGHLLGYEESAHFSKFFRVQTGLPPIKWRDRQKSGSVTTRVSRGKE